MKKIFIDGSAGTTGLRIRERLGGREDISLIVLPEEQRKDTEARRRALNEADIAFLCLPDAAAIEAVSLVENPDTVIIDTSTAHRTLAGWTYGYPELAGERWGEIAGSKRIAVPGCHAGGFVALVQPLIRAGLLPASAELTCHSLTGYSGGGKGMIADYQSEERSPLLSAPRQYGIAQQHKHLKEMRAISGLEKFPLFCPIVGDFYSGMEVTVPLFAGQLTAGASAADIRRAYAETYRGPVVTYRESADEGGFLSAGLHSGKDSMTVTVCGNEERILLVAMYDNLGKGASGAAIECMNIVMGVDPTEGLEL